MAKAWPVALACCYLYLGWQYVPKGIPGVPGERGEKDQETEVAAAAGKGLKRRRKSDARRRHHGSGNGAFALMCGHLADRHSIAKKRPMSVSQPELHAESYPTPGHANRKLSEKKGRTADRPAAPLTGQVLTFTVQSRRRKTGHSDACLAQKWDQGARIKKKAIT